MLVFSSRTKKRHVTVPKNNIDLAFISAMEGGCILNGYVPEDKKKGVESGVTVACGVDLGNPNIYYLEGFPTKLKLKLKPYIGRTGDKARAAIKAIPLTLTQDEADLLQSLVYCDLFANLISLFNKASVKDKFIDLYQEQQTAIADVAIQYGYLLYKRTPKFWKAVTTGDWKGAIRELRNFGDAYSIRRNKEADLIQSILPKGK